MSNFKNITIVIADRPFSLKIRSDEEVFIREVAEEVNRKIAHFETAYKQRDKKDCLSMALLTFAVEGAKLKNKDASSLLAQKINRLDTLLEQALNENIE